MCMAEQLSLWDLVGEEGDGGACSPDGMEPLRPADAAPDASSEGAVAPDGIVSSRGAGRTRAAAGLVPDTVTASGERRLAQGSEPVCGYVSVVVDVPSRALSDPFAYAVPASFDEEAVPGAIVLVSFHRRMVAGYVVMRASELAELPGAAGLAPERVLPVRSVLAERAFGPVSAQLAFWMSREYVASVAECLRLFLPPKATPRVRKLEDGSYEVERPKTKEVHERWVTLTDEGRGYRPAVNAHRQRQLMEALSCGPVTTRELNFLYSSMSATIRTLEKKGIVAIEERRAWRSGKLDGRPARRACRHRARAEGRGRRCGGHRWGDRFGQDGGLPLRHRARARGGKVRVRARARDLAHRADGRPFQVAFRGRGCRVPLAPF